MKGTIKALVVEKRFGFISREGDANGKDLFFHANELNGVEWLDLKIGDTVTFEEVAGQKGPAATNVSRA